MPDTLSDILERGVVIFDGAMGTSLHARNLDLQRDYLGLENCSEILNRTRSDVIQEIHESFLAAGADAVETNTFGANRLVLAEFGLEHDAFELNRAAAEIARAACERHATGNKPRFVIGSMGPGTKLVTLGQTDWDTMLASYQEQAAGLIAGGADALMIETCQDLLQVKCAINACLSALSAADKGPENVPILVSVTIETTGTMLLGTEIAAVCAALRSYPIVSLGLNCATGPAEMHEHVRYLGRFWPGTVSVIPNAGLPTLVDGAAVFPLAPEPFAEALVRYVVENGVGIVGGCCGTTPEHIRVLAEALGDHATIPASSTRKSPAAAACTSLYSPVEYRQDRSFLIVGERMNASGSRKFKRLLEAEEWDGAVSMAREQVSRDGAHVLDLNVDYAGRDNAADMAEIAGRIARQVGAPLMLDSTQVATLEAGLKRAGGRCIINSANFEDGDERFDTICRLAKTYGAGLIIGSIDEDPQEAMARTSARKLAVAERGYERATSVHGLDPRDLFFDPLVLPISTGLDTDRRSGLETIEGVRRIAERFPNSQTVAGVSNVSFGLVPAARVVLNSVFLHEMIGAGLTAAIVHASKILPRNRIPGDRWEAALDLIYDRPTAGDDPLQRFIALFQGLEKGAPAPEAGPNIQSLSVEDRLRRHIIDGEKANLAQTLEEARTKYAPLEIINDHLLDGMKTVGELFGSGQMQLPFVLQSAEVMKTAVAHLEPHMERVSGRTRGTMVLATVKGDVHDIGKNLVDIILSNNGYRVINLGIKQPIAAIIEAWREHNADAIGLSGLLVKSVGVMKEDLLELNEQDITVPVILGGAALSRGYCESELRDTYRGRCYYGKDAFEGLRLMGHIAAGTQAQIDGEIRSRLEKRAAARAVIDAARQRPEPAAPDASDPVRAVPVPLPPFWGARIADGIDPAAIYPYINKIALFRGQWQFRRGALDEAAYAAMLAEQAEPVFDRLCRQCAEDGVLQPRVVWGYFPVQSDGDDLVVFAPDDHGREIERFRFPRQRSRQRRCISDFFRTRDSGEVDVLGLHCVTMGPGATRRARELFEADSYREYLYLHGFGVECAEALAELWHKRIRAELSIGGDDSDDIRELFTQHYRGSRYSFGYPACPDMSDQERLFRLLDPGRIGCTLTENWQIDPEQSTSAIIVHHPEAKYFAV